MVKLSESQEYIKRDLIYRLRQEAREHGMEVKLIVIEAEEEEKHTKREKVKEYMEENTERTENKKDIISVKEIWEQYDDWNRIRGGVETYIDTTREMGVYLSQLEYEKEIMKRDSKVIRGYKNIKFKGESTSVKEFLKKYTTEDEEKRISIMNLLRVYNVNRRERGEGEKISTTEFTNKARKHGYKMKAAVEKPTVISIVTGKTKRRNGTTRKGTKIAERCLMRLKWKEEEVKKLDENVYKEIFREEIEQGVEEQCSSRKALPSVLSPYDSGEEN